MHSGAIDTEDDAEVDAGPFNLAAAAMLHNCLNI
jgi:hypothetical protein